MLRLVTLHFTVKVEDLRDPGDLNGWKTYTEFYMTCKWKWFMFHRILRQAHLKEVGVTQNWKTMMWLQHLTTIGFAIIYCGEGPTWRGWQWNSIRLRAQPHMSLHYTWKAHIHTKFNFSFPWYDLGMSFEGLKCKLAPHLLQRFQNFKDMWKYYLRIGW